MNSANLGAGVQPQVREAIDLLELGPLPFIRGTWYFVDPTSGGNGRAGKSIADAVADLPTAYARASDGDGIALLSYGATSAATTSYLTKTLAWAKNGITVVGVAAPVGMFGRARVANKTITTGALTTISFTADHTISDSAGGFLAAGFAAGQTISVSANSGTNSGAFTIETVTATTITTTAASTHVSTEDAATAGSTTIVSYNADLLLLSGANNRFINVHFWNGGANALEVGGLNITGVRNYFQNCHIVGGAGAATAATHYSLKLDAAEENTFVDCAFGSDSFAQGDNAAAEIVLNGVLKRNRFKGCEILGMVSAGTAHGAVKSVGTSGGAPTAFKSCLFNYGLSTTTLAAAHLVSGSVDKVILQDCAAVKVTAWGTYVYANMVAPAASAGGGLATTA